MWSAEKDGLAQKYREIVKQCLTNESVFNGFKSNNDFISIVGTPSPFQLRHFMNKIEDFPEIMSHFDDFRVNDKYGNPPHIDPKSNLSLGTIRYIHSLCDLKKHFGSLDNMVISEMGCGYGGLALIINLFFKPKSYYVIDLPEVQQLTVKYLTLHKVSVLTEPPPLEVDLFISEFCLSEFDDEDLYKFYDMYVLNARNTYLQMNLIDEDRKQRFIKHMNQEFGLEIRSEGHGTRFPAYVIIGKKE